MPGCGKVTRGRPQWAGRCQRPAPSKSSMTARGWLVAIASKAPVPVSFRKCAGVCTVQVSGRSGWIACVPARCCHRRWRMALNSVGGIVAGKAQDATLVKLVTLSGRRHVSPCFARRDCGGCGGDVRTLPTVPHPAQRGFDLRRRSARCRCRGARRRRQVRVGQPKAAVQCSAGRGQEPPPMAGPVRPAIPSSSRETWPANDFPMPCGLAARYPRQARARLAQERTPAPAPAATMSRPLKNTAVEVSADRNSGPLRAALVQYIAA